MIEQHLDQPAPDGPPSMTGRGADPCPGGESADTGHSAEPAAGTEGAFRVSPEEDTLELDPPPALPGTDRGGHRAELLDSVAQWPSVTSGVGEFRLVPVRLPQDLPRVVEWMNDPRVAEFWELSGPARRTEEHVRSQVEGDGRSVPCLGVLDGRPMSYWEIYRADLDRLAEYVPVRPHDTGLHLLLGEAADRGRGLGGSLLRAVGDLVLAQRPRCGRVLAEPDVRNPASVTAFLRGGFRLDHHARLPEKQAAVMIRER